VNEIKFSYNSIMINILIGFSGGLIRGLVGFIKNKTFEKTTQFKIQYFLAAVLISGIVGGAAGLLADGAWQIAFLAGYAGADFLEGLYKIKLGQQLTAK